MKLRYVVFAWFVLGMAFVFAGEGLLERTWWGLALCLLCGTGMGLLIKHEMHVMSKSC